MYSSLFLLTYIQFIILLLYFILIQCDADDVLNKPKWKPCGYNVALFTAEIIYKSLSVVPDANT